MAEFAKVATAAEVLPGQAKLVEAGGKKIALFNVGGAYYAIDEACPHRGGPLSQGPVEGGTVTFPRHGSKVDINNRAAVAAPAAPGVARHRARVISLGRRVGVATGNLEVWLAVGIGVGAALGAVLSRRGEGTSGGPSNLNLNDFEREAGLVGGTSWIRDCEARDGRWRCRMLGRDGTRRNRS